MTIKTFIATKIILKIKRMIDVRVCLVISIDAVFSVLKYETPLMAQCLDKYTHQKYLGIKQDQELAIIKNQVFRF